MRTTLIVGISGDSAEKRNAVVLDFRGQAHPAAAVAVTLEGLEAQLAANPPADVRAVLESAIAERRALLARLSEAPA